MSKCEGDCEEHLGEAVNVKVEGNEARHMKGEHYFHYCISAIAHDRAQGYTVIPTCSKHELMKAFEQVVVEAENKISNLQGKVEDLEARLEDIKYEVRNL